MIKMDPTCQRCWEEDAYKAVHTCVARGTCSRNRGCFSLCINVLPQRSHGSCALRSEMNPAPDQGSLLHTTRCEGNQSLFARSWSGPSGRQGCCFPTHLPYSLTPKPDLPSPLPRTQPPTRPSPHSEPKLALTSAPTTTLPFTT